MGHAIRTGVILEELQKDYDVMVFASERGYNYLSEKFPNVYEINGFNTVYENNSVQNIKTFKKCIKDLPKDIKKNMRVMNKRAVEFEPNIIISDFEHYSNSLSYMLRVPVISIDNMHSIRYCKIDYPNKYKIEKIKAESVIKTLFAKYKRIIITSFFFPPIKKPEKIVMYPPILRDEIIKRNGNNYENYITVYQTSQSNNQLIEVLKERNEKFIIYGFNKTETDDNLIYKEFNEEEFYDDIENTQAVIANGGFTFISEALYLGKPIFSMPTQGNFEQILNACYVEKLNYGEMHDDITSETLSNFIDKIPEYKKSLEEYERQDNSALINDLKNSIEEFSVEFNPDKTRSIMKTIEKRLG